MDFGFRISDFGFLILDFGFRILDFGFRILDFGALCSNSSCANFGFWISDFGFWISDFGFWIFDFGLGAFSGTFFGCYIIELVLCTPTRVGGFFGFCDDFLFLSKKLNALRCVGRRFVKHIHRCRFRKFCDEY